MTGVQVTFDGKGFIEVSPQEVLDRFTDLLESYEVDEEQYSDVFFNFKLAAYGTACMTAVGVLLSAAEVYTYIQEQIGVMISSLYRAVQKDLNMMNEVAKEYKEKPTLHFNDMMKKFS